MTILEGDLRLLASTVMLDTPEGGGPPSATVIQDGKQNGIFPDITSIARATGDVAMRKVFADVHTLNTDSAMDMNAIIEEPPEDPLVAITMMAGGTTFDRRTDARARLEAYSQRGSEISGYLLENHVTGLRSIQILQRPSSPLFPIGVPLFLVYLEGQAGQRVQPVRPTRVTYEERTATVQQNNQATDFQVRVATVDIESPLLYDFPGSPPSRYFTPEANKTRIRASVASDAGRYFGVSALSAAATMGSMHLQVQSIYSQLVPSGRAETPAIDQLPAGRPTVVLATAPRRVELTVPPHTQRIRIGDANRGYAYTTMLRPLPEPGTVRVDYLVMGVWYSLLDDGQGKLVAEGINGAVGVVNYLTGSVQVTLADYPDLRSALIISWASRTQFVNRSGTAIFRAPEFALQLEHAPVKAATLTLQWESDGVLKTATANAAGVLSGDATGELNHASGKLFWRPLAMPDPGGEFQLSYQWAEMVEKSVPGITPDAGGFATIALDHVPAAGSVSVRWITVRSVSASSGSSSGGTAAQKSSTSTTTNVYYPPPPPAPAPAPGAAPSPNDTVFTRPPVKTTRVNAHQGNMSASGERQYGMFPVGTDASGKDVFVAVPPTAGSSGSGGGTATLGWGYAVPDGSGVVWTPAELAAGAITLNGITYRTWSAHLGA